MKPLKKNKVSPFLHNRETRKTKTPLFALLIGYLFRSTLVWSVDAVLRLLGVLYDVLFGEFPCVFIVFLIYTKLGDKGSNKTFTKKTFPVFFSLGIFK